MLSQSSINATFPTQSIWLIPFQRQSFRNFPATASSLDCCHAETPSVSLVLQLALAALYLTDTIRLYKNLSCSHIVERDLGVVIATFIFGEEDENCLP